MKIVKILGSGCKNCETLAKETQKAADSLGIEIKLEKVTEYEQILSYGVMSTPGLVIDEDLKSSGKVLKSKEIEKYL